MRTEASGLRPYPLLAVLAMLAALIATLASQTGPTRAASSDNGDSDGVSIAAVVPLTVSQDWFATDAVPPAFFFDAALGFTGDTFTYSSTDPTVVSVTDDFCKGDVFRIYDNGVPIGETNAVPSEAPECSGEVGPDAAFADPTYSSGIFELPPGDHEITIEVIQLWSADAPGQGYIQVHEGCLTISPSQIEEVIFPGGSVEITKCVQVPEIPPTPDVFFLVDTTGSMGDDIATIQDKLDEIIAAVGTETSEAQYGVGHYEDWPFDPWGLETNECYTLDQAITPDAMAVQTAINGLSTFLGSGGDTPECGYEALYQTLTGAGRSLPNPDGTPPDGDTTDTGEIDAGQDAGFRADAQKVIFLVGDAAFHDPGDPPASMQFASGYPGAGEADVLAEQGDVTIVCLIPAELEGVGPEAQCNDLGALVFDVGESSEDIVDAMLAALGEIEVEVTMESTCEAPITTTFEPESQTAAGGTSVFFTETISVAFDAPGGTYACLDVVRIDGELLTDEQGQVVSEVKTIHVPEGFLTGGGQITSGKGKNVERINFGGNVGFLEDFSLVGQWQTKFHNVGTDSLDGAIFHSTEITHLQFFHDGGAGPEPPPANANVANFIAEGRVKLAGAGWETGWTLEVCLADRGEPGRNNDSILLILTSPGGDVYHSFMVDGADFNSTTMAGECDTNKLDSGNFQIHSGIKE